MPKKTLSKRQFEVLRRLAEGQQLKAIAFDIGSTFDGVTSSVRCLKAKLLAKTIPHVVAQAFREGLLK